MRILWISHLVPYPPKAGVLIRSYNLVKQLGQRCHVDIIMLNQPRLLGSYFDSQQAGKEAAREALAKYVHRQEILEIPAENTSASLRRLQLSSLFDRRGYTMRWLLSETLEQTAKQWAESGKYDLIHLDTISLDFLRPILTPFAPVALDHHNIESHMMRRRAEKESNPLKKAYFQLEFQRLHRAEQDAVGQYAGNIVCSEDDRQRLLEIDSAAEVRVIPNGIDISGERPARSPDALKLLFIGGMSWYPNLAAVRDLIFNVAPELRRRGVEFHLDIIGKGPTQDVIDATDAEADITLHGFVDDIAPYYEQASAFICPINDGGGTKLKILDAMAKRLPIIGYPLACEGIEVVHGETALIGESPAALADAVELIGNDPALRDRLGDGGRQLVEQSYDFEIIGQSLHDYYNGLAASASGTTQ